MSDRYLFRGKRIDTGEWVEGSLVYKEFGKSYISGWYVKYYKIFDIDPNTIGQCTGLKDKNDKLIFEGDIVACGDSGVPTLVYWCSDNHAWYAKNIKRSESHPLDKYFKRFVGVIIGNIFDNPELANGGEIDDKCTTSKSKL